MSRRSWHNGSLLRVERRLASSPSCASRPTPLSEEPAGSGCEANHSLLLPRVRLAPVLSRQWRRLGLILLLRRQFRPLRVSEALGHLLELLARLGGLPLLRQAAPGLVERRGAPLGVCIQDVDLEQFLHRFVVFLEGKEALADLELRPRRRRPLVFRDDLAVRLDRRLLAP